MQVSHAFFDALMDGRVISQNWRWQLQRVRCPVLLFTRDLERDGLGDPPELAADAARPLPGLEAARISGAGHNIRREQFDRILEVVRGFLARRAAPAKTSA
jgi:N-formylmaleamate deformylase